MGRLVGVVACAVACGAPQRAPEERAPEVKIYAPLGIKADAKSPHQAVILGTDAKNGSTLIPLPAASSNAVVDALFVKLAAPVAGGMSSVKLATAPNADGSVQVGIFEAMAGGTGPQWRAGVWMSAFVAATTLNKDLTDFTFSAASSGYIDGASASGLMAAGFLAAITGTEVDTKATMTGIINPDGTIGPVDGIPEKLLASIEKGKKRIGYPIGERYATSLKTNAAVDLVALAKEHGAEAVEIADVHQAYTLLTGKRLPEPVPLSEAEMAVDAGTDRSLEVKYKQWQQRLAIQWAPILQLDSAGRLPAALVSLRDATKRYAQLADQMHTQGKLGAAYASALAATTYATATNQIYDVMSKVQANKVPDALATLDKLDKLDELTAATFDKIGAIKPPTLGGHLQMMAAFRSALRGYVFAMFAKGMLQATKEYVKSLTGTSAAQLGSGKIADALVEHLAPTLLYVGKTTAETTLATEQLDFEGASDVQYLCSVPNVRRMATSFSSAGAAGLNYFDTLFVQPLAASAHVSEDEARERIALYEPDYLVSALATKLTALDGLPKRLKDSWGESSLAWGLLSLAASELAYYHSALLIAKYYSLDASTNEDGQIVKVGHEKAFANMLATAERNARASARAARIATGAIPVQARLAYQLAAAERDGSLGDKLDALSQYWTSSAYSQTAVALARN